MIRSLRNHWRVAGSLLFASLVLPAAAPGMDIYRCETDAGVVEYSDRPCDGNAQPHQPRNRLSIVAPSENLEEVRQRNREFLLRRAEARADRLEQASVQRAQRQEQAQADFLRALLEERNRAEPRLPLLIQPGFEADEFSGRDAPAIRPATTGPEARRRALSDAETRRDLQR